MDSNGFTNNSFQQEVAPSFMFGERTHKRKALALNGRPSGFGSPSILKKDLSISSPGKNVRWSTDLVQEQVFSNKTTSPLVNSNPFLTAPNFASSISKGPPLSSLDTNDVEPPQKLQRPDVNLERRESALNAISNNLGAFNTQTDSSDFWVTVFGFSAEDKDMILDVFSRHGNIVSHNIPRVGNWIHLRYSSVLHAQQALKRDGNIFANRLMVGVTKCTDKEVVSDARMNPLNSSVTNVTEISFSNPVLQSTFKNVHDDEHQANGTPRSSVNYSDAASFNRSRLTALSRNGMRSLRASELELSLDNSMRKDESFLSKFWNFVAPQ